MPANVVVSEIRSISFSRAKISILRLDTDFYESTKIELEVLYPRLEKNGILIIDDYGTFKGARKAVDEYFKTKPFLIYIDHTCRLLIKNQ